MNRPDELPPLPAGGLPLGAAVDLSHLAGGRPRFGAWQVGEPHPDRLAEMGPHGLARCQVNDGWLYALVFERPTGWHVQLTHQANGNRGARALTVAEVHHARDALIPPDVLVIQTIPAGVAGIREPVDLFEYPPRGNPLPADEEAQQP